MPTDLIDELRVFGRHLDATVEPVTALDVARRVEDPPTDLAVASTPRRSRARWVLAATTGAAAAAVLAVVFVGVGDEPDPVQPDATTSIDTDAVATTVTPTTVEPVDTSLTSTEARSLQTGDVGDDVQGVEVALAASGFDPGVIDGVFDGDLEQAVWAYEGRVLQRPWQEQKGRLAADEVADLVTGPTVVAVKRPDAGRHVEIDLPTQTIVVADGADVVLVAHTSGGSGEQWCEEKTVDADIGGRPIEPELQRLCGTAVTPGGVYSVYRKVSGEITTAFGSMDDVVLFNYFVGVHAARVVPREPVTHGTLRLTARLHDRFVELVEIGHPVYVFDGVHRPEHYGAQPPIFPWMNPD